MRMSLAAALLLLALTLTQGECERTSTWNAYSRGALPFPWYEVTRAASLKDETNILALSSASSDSVLVMRASLGTYSGESYEVFVVLRRGVGGGLNAVWRALASDAIQDSSLAGLPAFAVHAGMIVCSADSLLYQLSSVSGDSASLARVLRDSLVLKDGLYVWSPAAGTYVAARGPGRTATCR
jgi:hypothetical protein